MSQSYACSYATLSTYNYKNDNITSSSVRSNARTIIPTFSPPPGYKTGYANNAFEQEPSTSTLTYRNIQDTYGTQNNKYLVRLNR
jgi:hypothetical protein